MSNLTVTQAAEARRSIRKYTDQAVSTETLNEILRVAGLAPSPWNLQPWRVIVVRNPEVKAKLMGAAYGQPQVGAAQAVFVIYSDMEDTLGNVVETVHPGMPDKAAAAEGILGILGKMSRDDQEAWAYAESNIFLGYLLLAIQEQGLASSPMLGFVPDHVRELFGLPAHVRFPAIVAVGYGAEEGFTHHRHGIGRFATFID